MANDFSSNPIVLDTVGNAASAATYDLGSKKIKLLVWTPTTGGDDLKLSHADKKTPAAGDVFVEVKGVQYQPVVIPVDTTIHGIWLETLDSGKVYLYT